MSEEEIKKMVNNAFKRLSKELEENPDNLINYSKLQEKYIQLLKDKVKLKQENQKYKEVINRLSKIIYEIDELRKNTGGYPTDYMDNLVNILKEVEND